VGECSFWYRPTRVVLDKKPLNSCVCANDVVTRPGDNVATSIGLR